MLRWWTVGRASGLGASAALAAILLWPFHARQGEALLWPFAAAAAVAGLCGLSILLITAADMALRRRGEQIRPVRAFDIGLALVLLLLAALQLEEVLGQLPAA
jgi:hypothetical protein